MHGKKEGYIKMACHLEILTFHSTEWCTHRQYMRDGQLKRSPKMKPKCLNRLVVGRSAGHKQLFEIVHLQWGRSGVTQAGRSPGPSSGFATISQVIIWSDYTLLWAKGQQWIWCNIWPHHKMGMFVVCLPCLTGLLACPIKPGHFGWLLPIILQPPSRCLPDVESLSFLPPYNETVISGRFVKLYSALWAIHRCHLMPKLFKVDHNTVGSTDRQQQFTR